MGTSVFDEGYVDAANEDVVRVSTLTRSAPTISIDAKLRIQLDQRRLVKLDFAGELGS